MVASRRCALERVLFVAVSVIHVVPAVRRVLLAPRAVTPSLRLAGRSPRGIVVAEADEVMHARLAHVAERDRRGGRVLRGRDSLLALDKSRTRVSRVALDSLRSGLRRVAPKNIFIEIQMGKIIPTWVQRLSLLLPPVSGRKPRWLNAIALRSRPAAPPRRFRL